MRQFDSMLRQGLMDANLAQYERALQSAESGEIDFSPRYLRERMRFLADPWSWARRRGQPGQHRRARMNWRLIAVVAALLLLSACAYAVVTGQFSQWFPWLGADPQSPETSEEVLTRTGTLIEQSQTVDGAMVTLNAAVWDGDYLHLSLAVQNPGFPEELTEDSNLYTEECRLELREDQKVRYMRKELEKWTDATPEELEERFQLYMEMDPPYLNPGFGFLSLEGDTLTFDVGMRLKTHVEQPELTLHIENIAIYEESEDPTVRWLDGVRTGPGPGVPVLGGPFDFTFTLGEPILPVYYAGETEIAPDGVPLRFTGLEIAVFDLNAEFEVLAPMNPVQVTRPDQPEPEPDPDKRSEDAVKKAMNGAVLGLWTEDGGYVDCSETGGSSSLSTNQDGSEAHGSKSVNYPHPVDPATVTAVNLGGVRVELSQWTEQERPIY